MTRINNIVNFIVSVSRAIKNIFSPFILYIENYIVQYHSIKNKKLKKIISDNLDACELWIDNISSVVSYNTPFCKYKINSSSTKNNESYEGVKAYDEFIVNSDSSISLVNNESFPDQAKNIQNGTYYLKLGKNKLAQGKRYLLSIYLKQGLNYTPVVNIINNHESKGMAAALVYNNYVDFNKNVFPYVQKKQSSIVKISSKCKRVGSNSYEYVNCANILSEHCEVSSVQSLFAKDENGYVLGLMSCNTGSFNPSSSLGFANVSGGQGFSEGSCHIIIRNGTEKNITLKFDIENLNNFTSNFFKDSTNGNRSNISEIIVQLEEFYDESEPRSLPKDPSNINNPELDYGDGGERYYEPWKFWFEGNLRSDENGGASWYKKWKSWFKKKVKNHNDRLDGKGTEDIDAWMEDNKHKGDHL